MMSLTHKSRRSRQLLSAFFLLLAFLCRLAFWRIPMFDIDESLFAVASKVFLQGGLPYANAVDIKPVGIFLYYILAFVVFGEPSLRSVHILTTVVLACSASITHYICRDDLRLSRTTSLITAILLIFEATFSHPKMMAASINMVMMLPLLLCTRFYLRWCQNQQRRDLALAGLVGGIAFLLKYQAGVLLPIVLVHLYWQKRQRITTHINAFPFLIWFLLPTLCELIFFCVTGIFTEFWLYNFYGNLGYITRSVEGTRALSHLLTRALPMLFWFAPVLVGVAITITREWRQKSHDTIKIFLILSCIGHFLAICVGGRFYPHYFLQPLPFLLILGIPPLVDYGRQKTFLKRSLLIIFLSFWLLVPLTRCLFDWTFTRLHAHRHDDNHPEIYQPVSRYLAEHTQTDDTIFVWGNATPIYYFSNRAPAARFLWCDSLTGLLITRETKTTWRTPLAEKVTTASWNYFWQDLAKNQPVYFVDTATDDYHHYKQFKPEAYPDLHKYLDLNYTREKSIDGIILYRRRD